MPEQAQLDVTVGGDYRVAAALERLADQQQASFRSMERQTVALEQIAQALTSIVVFAREQDQA
jgi:hypothetical protein